MSTNDDTLNTTMNTTEMSADDDYEMTWMDTNSRGQIVRRQRRFSRLTGREGFADYVEKAYWNAQRLGLLEELAALPSLEGKTVTEIAGLTRALGERIRERMWTFHAGYGPNLYYGALTRMVEAAKEDVSPTTAAAAGEEAAVALQRRQTMGGVESSPLPALPTSPLLRQSATGAAVVTAETVSDSEIELGRSALRAENDGDMVIRSTAAIQSMLAARIATAAAAGWSDISGHPFVGRPGVTGSGAAAFIRTVPAWNDISGGGGGDANNGERDSDEESASVEEDGDGHEVTGTVDDGGSVDTEGGDDGHEVTGTVDDGADADTEGGDNEDEDEDEDEDADGEDTEPEEEAEVAPIQHVPVPVPALRQNIGLELPLWAWLAILVAFTAWAAFVNMALSRDLGCRAFGR